METKEIRIASLTLSEEMKGMEVGDIVRFPIGRYNYNSVRSAPSSSLIEERLKGWSWRTRLNLPEKAVDVIRVS